jgi:hypothetical protein
MLTGGLSRLCSERPPLPLLLPDELDPDGDGPEVEGVEDGPEVEGVEEDDPVSLEGVK